MDTSGLGSEQNNKEFELVPSLEFGFWPLTYHCVLNKAEFISQYPPAVQETQLDTLSMN